MVGELKIMRPILGACLPSFYRMFFKPVFSEPLFRIKGFLTKFTMIWFFTRVESRETGNKVLLGAFICRISQAIESFLQILSYQMLVML